MPPRIPSYRSRWGSDFSFEPEDVYQEKESERTRQLVSTAQRQRYGTDRPGFFGNLVRAPLQQAIGQMAERRASLAAAGPPEIPTTQSSAPRGYLLQARAEGGGGGGFLGKLKDVGGKALDVLDAASETTLDIVRTPINPVSGAVNLGVAAAGFGRDIVAGRGAGESLQRAGSSLAHGASGGGLPQNIVAARGDPRGVYGRQLSDFRSRPIEEQLAVGTIFDPTNVIGAGALTTGLKAGAKGAKTARSASLLNRLARVNKAADVAQTRFAPEVAGTIAGAIGAQTQGEDPLKGAALGLALGAGAHGAARLAGRKLATSAIPALQVDIQTPGLERYIGVIGEYGIDIKYDDAGRIVADPDQLSHAFASARRSGDSDAMQLLTDLSDDVLAQSRPHYLDAWEGRKIGGDREARWLGEGQPRKPTAAMVEGQQRAWAWVDGNTGENPRDLIGRIRGRLLQMEDDHMASFGKRRGGQNDPAAFGGTKGKPSTSSGAWETRKPLAEQSPASLIKLMGGENYYEWRTLNDIAENFERHVDDAFAAPAASQTVKRVDLEGNVTDTFQTEAELNGIRATQGGLDLEGRAAAAEVPQIPGARSRDLSKSAQKRGVKAVAQPTGRPTGGVGTQVEQPTLAGERAAVSGTGDVGPPRGTGDGGALPPGGPPEGIGPGNPQRAFGDAGDEVDLLRVKPREQYIAEAQQRQSTRLGRAGQRATQSRAKLLQPEVEGVRQMKQDTDHIVNELVDNQVDRTWQAVEDSGLAFEQGADGNWTLNGVPWGDVVEGATEPAQAVRAAFTPEQQRALDNLLALRDQWVRTAEGHGATIPKRTTESGDFWHRQVVARDLGGGKIVEKGQAPTGTSRRSVGANRLGTRTQETVTGATSEGIIYAHPRDEFRQGLRNVALMGQDAALARMVEPLAVDATAGFGNRALKGNHPAFTQHRVVGNSSGGAAIMTDRSLVFPNEVADQLDDIFGSSKLQDTKLGGALTAVNAVATPVRASTDVSFLLNQGLGFLESSPQNAMKAIKAGVKVIASASGKPEVYRQLRAENLARGQRILGEAGIADDVSDWLIQHRLHRGSGQAADEFLFTPGTRQGAGKLPGPVGKVVQKSIDWSNETFARYLDYARETLAIDALERYVGQGMRGAELDAAIEGANRSINRMSGWTGTAPSSVEAIGLFAPRFFRSQLEQIAVAVTQSFGRSTIEGEVARRHLLKLAATGAVITYAVNERNGYDTDLDPRSYNFMRIRNVFGHDISPYGSFATLFRGIAQTVGGQPGEAIGPDIGAMPAFLRAKASPVISTLWTVATGRTFDQRPVTRDPFDDPKGFATSALDIAAENVPFSVQAAVREGPLAGLVSATGAQGSQVTPAEKRDFARNDVARDLFERNYDDLSGAEKAQVNQDERVSKHQREVDRRRMERTGTDAKRAEADVSFRDKMLANGQFLTAGKDEAGNPFSGNDYREAWERASIERRAVLAALEDSSGGDAVVDGYFDLYEQAEMANGAVNYDLFNRIEEAYIDEHPDVLDRLEEIIGARDDPVMGQFRIAREQAREYYDIPPVRGMDLETGNRANEILKVANALVAAGAAANRRGALNLMSERGEITDDEIGLALQAGRLGANPERKAYRVSHPEFRKFYSDAPGVGDLDAAFPISQSAQRRTSGGGSGGALRRSRRRTRSGLRR